MSTSLFSFLSFCKSVFSSVLCGVAARLFSLNLKKEKAEQQYLIEI
jgi:hypothetical protein